MDKQTLDEKPMLSRLKIRHILFDKLSFDREGFKTSNKEVGLEIGVTTRKESDGKYRVSLHVLAHRESEFTASVDVSAYCELDEEWEIKNEILEKNVVAILFPYVRSELTLLTAQPETEPIVLPAFNINALMKNDPS